MPAGIFCGRCEKCVSDRRPEGFGQILIWLNGRWANEISFGEIRPAIMLGSDGKAFAETPKFIQNINPSDLEQSQ
ncbi:hypothetical protein [uncultured Fibrobacter sp.]|uniref:hypothetical protein n=1 Tax=uncultured Fibrobacter sp. TaxID=261512 RepID=UPI00259239AB|nr:hypothetical protein [uncultured Fibrobacter sp.]